MPYQTKNGRWRAEKIINGQRKTKLCKTKTEAKKWEAEQTAEDWHAAQTRMACLFDVADAYLSDAKSRYHASTYESKRFALRLLIKEAGPAATPDDITPRLALSIMMKRARSVSNSAANHTRKQLAAFWVYASSYYGWPRENPFRDLKRLPENGEHHYVPPASDFWKVYAVADEVDRTLLLALLYTAGRRSEPFRWIWENDIDLTNHRIRLSTCKTKSGSRRYEWMTMPERLYDALARHRSANGGSGFVFRSKRTGEQYVTRTQWLVRLCKRAGVQHFNYHGIRGLCATLLAANGASMKEIQGVLMHSNMLTTDRYIRSIGGASNRLLDAFSAFEKETAASKIVPFETAV